MCTSCYWVTTAVTVMTAEFRPDTKYDHEMHGVCTVIALSRAFHEQGRPGGNTPMAAHLDLSNSTGLNRSSGVYPYAWLDV